MKHLTDQILEVVAEEDPLNPFFDGAVPALDGRLVDVGEDAEHARRDRAAAIADGARDAHGLDPETRGVVVQQGEAIATRVEARLVEHTMLDYAIAPLTVVLTRLPRLRPEDAHGERRFLERLAAVPRYLADAAARHRSGLAAGRLPVAERVRAALGRLDAHLADPVADPLRRPALSERSAAQREEILAREVRPALIAYRDLLARELGPKGRPPERTGLCWLPEGEATYAALVRTYTTTPLGAEEIHRTGLELIDRFGEEYVAQGERLFGARTIADVLQRLAEDPSLRWESPEQLLATARAAVERAEEAAPRLFGRLPSQRCVVAETPPAEAPNASNAMYNPGPFDGSRPGVYYANTHRFAERHRCLAEAAAFHEVVPGHHLQITLAQERADLPLIRRSARIDAYLEGWSLYSEHLADEAGLYSDELYRLGMRAHDLTRASRLVVDTGLHALGWPRERAVGFLRDHSAMSELEVQHEVDRAIEMPAQTLAYGIGMLEFDRLRERTARALGSAFDLPAFHDAMLGTGPVPLGVLDDAMARWTEQVPRR